MSGSSKMVIVEVVTSNFLVSVLNQAGQVSDTASAAVGTFANLVCLAVEEVEKNGGVLTGVSKQKLARTIIPKLAPSLGAASNDYVNLGIALGSFGFSASGVQSAAAAFLIAGEGAAAASFGALVVAGIALAADSFMLGMMLAHAFPSDYQVLQAQIKSGQLAAIRARVRARLADPAHARAAMRYS